VLDSIILGVSLSVDFSRLHAGIWTNLSMHIVVKTSNTFFSPMFGSILLCLDVIQIFIGKIGAPDCIEKISNTRTENDNLLDSKAVLI